MSAMAGDAAAAAKQTEVEGPHLEGILAVVWVQDAPEAYVPTVRSIAAAAPGIEIVIGGPSDHSVLRRLADPLVGASTISSANGTLSEAVRLGSIDAARLGSADAARLGSSEFTRHVLVVSAPVVLPPRALDRAVAALDDDLRLASVSFLSNAAGAFSVPHRNTPIAHQVGIHDEVSITNLLRTELPAPSMVPVAAPTGAAVVLSRFALGAVAGIDPIAAGSAEFLVADTALRAAQRGFLSALDIGTYVTRAFDLGSYRPHPIDDPSSVEWGHLAYRHPNSIDRYRRDAGGDNSALAVGLTTAASKIRGLRIIIDARDLGPKETGTQVSILCMVRELAARSDVASVQVGIPGPIPAYAVPYLSSEKIWVFTSPAGDLVEAQPADVIHRPSQPSSALPFDVWRTKANRVAVSLQDLIAYQVGCYHANGEQWQRYRDDLVDGAVGADVVISLSHETVRQIEAERLPLEPSRVFVVPCGTDHFTGEEPESFPPELRARGFVEQEFLLVLGTNYGHKNRDLAIRAWRTLQYAYPNLALVLAGAFVPAGSSRLTEALAIGSDSTGLFALPDVTSAERNWLVRHARVVLYPTSAEGFGLVPFEAARFGTPTVGIRFAPLDEFNDPPVWATGWTDLELATATGRLMESPDASAAQVRATLQHADRHRWADTAADLVRAYRFALSVPARRLPRG